MLKPELSIHISDDDCLVFTTSDFWLERLQVEHYMGNARYVGKDEHGYCYKLNL